MGVFVGPHVLGDLVGRDRHPEDRGDECHGDGEEDTVKLRPLLRLLLVLARLEQLLGDGVDLPEAVFAIGVQVELLQLLLQLVEVDGGA